MTTMRAALIRAWGGDPGWDDVERPERGAEEVLVRVEVASLNRLDITAADGVLGTDRELPYIGGVEGCGRVVEGPESMTGRRVLVRGGQIGLGRPGCWAEFVSAPVSAIIPLPDDLDPVLGATFFQPTTSAYVALHDVALLEPNDTVVVVGAAGAVGSQVVQQALALGATVIGVVGHDDQLGRLPEHIRRVSLTRPDDVARMVADQSGTLLVDTLGGPTMFDRIAWIRSGGRAVSIGYLGGTIATMNIPTWLMRDVPLLPLNMIAREHRAREVAPSLAERVARGELVIDVERTPPAEITDALRRLRGGLAKGRVVMSLQRDAGDY